MMKLNRHKGSASIIYTKHTIYTKKIKIPEIKKIQTNEKMTANNTTHNHVSYSCHCCWRDDRPNILHTATSDHYITARRRLLAWQCLCAAANRLVCCRYNKRREKLRIEQVDRNDSGIYACLTTIDQCRKWQNTTLVITGQTACLFYPSLS